MGRKALSIVILLLAIAAGLFPVGCDGLGAGSVFIAKRVSFGKWEDKRPSGSIIMHDMLILEEPRAYGSQGAPLGLYVVTTSGRMASKIDDVVSDRIPSTRGLKMNFAVGDPVSVRVEKVVEGGKRELVREARASFLEIYR
ncbi:MAG: hypothetical protein RLY21_686 [Planctomycetota bacterium]|jgi:hypothetical protein